ncbi:MAG TPA: methyltransferase domain-containing protein, partial [bacterium]|nr:methyltransferase domain-containing protein [bacterium]
TLIIDIRTGTGCLILSLLHELNKNGHEIKGLALDISKKALTVAKQNAKKLNIQNITFLHSNLLSTILKKPILFKQAKHIIILANLPYLTPQEIKKEKSISREPILALDGGKNGLELYEKLAQQINLLRQDFPIPITIICEINPRQKKLFEKIWSQPANFKVDLAKKVRIGLIRFN